MTALEGPTVLQMYPYSLKVGRKLCIADSARSCAGFVLWVTVLGYTMLPYVFPASQNDATVLNGMGRVLPHYKSKEEIDNESQFFMYTFKVSTVSTELA
jgi:hypothetical protein